MSQAERLVHDSSCIQDVLSALDDAIAALTRLRAELSSTTSATPLIKRSAEDDLSDLVDTWTAAARFDLPIDTVRWLAREKGLGQKRDGRWLCSIRALREHVAKRGG